MKYTDQDSLAYSLQLYLSSHPSTMALHPVDQISINSFIYKRNLLNSPSAIEMIQNTDSTLLKFSIEALPQHVGFKNVAIFNRAFQKHTGLKPSVFIKTLIDKAQ